MISVVTIRTPELGDRSYLVHDGTVALVVDPQRDIDRVLRAADSAGVRITHVAETHIHNDYVSGGLAMARLTGAQYLVSALDRVGFDRQPVDDGEVVLVGDMRVQVVATPGHTQHHLSYLVAGNTGDPADVPVAFTGGSLLYGSVGRTDLVHAALTEELTRAQFRSAHRLAGMLGDDVTLYPTHGFGSFCSSAPASQSDTSTMGEQRHHNEALTTQDEDRFVDELVAGLTAYPRYYAHMGARNSAGAPAPDLSPPEPVDPAELGRRLRHGEWVLDVRSRTAYAAAHVGGTVSVELGDQFSTYTGWLVPWDRPITLVAESPEQVRQAQLQLVRIGVERPAGAAVGSPESLSNGRGARSYRAATFADLAAARAAGERPAVLDVRRADERSAGAVAGSVHVPIHQLVIRMDDVPDTCPWVYCHSGFRANIAASILDRAGRDLVWINDDFASAEKAGLEITH